jgi:hypothetical protein
LGSWGRGGRYSVVLRAGWSLRDLSGTKLSGAAILLRHFLRYTISLTDVNFFYKRTVLQSHPGVCCFLDQASRRKKSILGGIL